MSARRRAELSLTQRALDDLRGIEQHSIERWGRRVAGRYIDDLEAGLQRVVEDPRLLRSEQQLHDALQFYRVNKHLFVCDVQDDSIIVLTVLHASMDVPARLAELQPHLSDEVELLHRRLRGGRS